MIEEAEREGKIQPGKTVLIEPTSGNTGIGLAFVAAVKGYKLILTMPDTMSLERRVLLLAFGAEIVLTPGPRGNEGRDREGERDSGATLRTATCCSSSTIRPIPRFISRPPVPRSGNDTDGKVDILISGVGTGGTITGVCEYIKPKKPSFKAIAVEPTESPVLSGGKPSSAQDSGHRRRICSQHPAHRSTSTKSSQVSNDESIAMARRLPLEEGLLVGISSGAAVVRRVASGASAKRMPAS